MNNSSPPTHLIVGASKGIGHTLLESSSQLHSTYALSRSRPISIPDSCTWVEGDASDPASYSDRMPPQIDALTFCPGDIILGSIRKLTTDEILKAFTSSVLDAFVLVKALLPRLRSSSLVFISTVAARSGLPNHCAISTAKSALQGFALSLSADLAPRTRVNVVAPTLTPTENGLSLVGGEKAVPVIEKRHPLKRLPAVSEVCDTINYLHSPSAQSITGQVISIDSGLSALRLNDS